MSSATDPNGPLIVGETAAQLPVRMFQWLSPVLIGLTAPIVFLMVALPDSVRHAQAVAGLMLFSAFLAASIAYALSVLEPGAVAGVELDPAAREVIVVQQGKFAAKRTRIRFDRIVSLRVAVRYDDDGYRSENPEFVLRDGNVLELPAQASAADVKAIRATIGLG